MDERRQRSVKFLRKMLESYREYKASCMLNEIVLGYEKEIEELEDKIADKTRELEDEQWGDDR